MTPPERNRSGAFRIEAGTMDGFLELLKCREEEGVPSEYDTLPRRAVFVAPLKHARLSEGVPLVTRRVRAAFAYGADLVTLTRLTASGYEFPSPSCGPRCSTPEGRPNSLACSGTPTRTVPLRTFRTRARGSC